MPYLYVKYCVENEEPYRKAEKTMIPPEVRPARCTILNPIPGKPCAIKRRQAARAVARGRARYVDADTIILLDNAQDEAEHHIADAWLWRQREAARSAAGYDDVRRMMSPEEVANIPVVNYRALIERGRKHLERTPHLRVKVMDVNFTPPEIGQGI